MEDNYTLLIRKINEFIGKYYKNQLIRGLLYSVASLGVFYIALILLEYFAWYNSLTRSVFFYLFIVTALVIMIRYLFIPLGKLKRIGRVISHEQAAKIIGIHFGEVKDQLLNTLQLKHLTDSNPQSRELIEASINQKIRNLQPIPFADAINLKENKRYLRYALPPIVFLISALLISPSLITEPSKRIIQHGEVFERPALFTVEIVNNKLEVIQQDDFILKVKIRGEEIPDQFFIETAGARYRMDKANTVSHSFTFRNLQQNTEFVISADNYHSKEYTIRVLPKPIILSFDIQAEYPSYLNRKSEFFVNSGDLSIPEGSFLTWKFYTRDTRKLLFRIGDKTSVISAGNSNAFLYTAKMLSSAGYSVYSSNEFFTSRDSLSYVVNVIPDIYPSITVDEFRDSIYDSRIYYKGTIKDDYGINKLTFNYSIKKSGEENVPLLQTKQITVEHSALQQAFYYFLDVATLLVSPGDEIEYFFEVWDNDGVNGSKATRSLKRVFRVPTLEEIEEQTAEKNKDIKDKMEQLMQQSRTLQKQIDEMNKKLVDKKEIGWQEKQQLKQMLEKQQMLQKQVEQVQKENIEKSRNEQQYKAVSPELIEKQEQIEKLFNQILPEEMKKMLEELQKMLEKVDKDKVSQMLEKMKTDSKDMEKQLDRTLELFKQLEFEKKLQETIDKMKQLAEEQNKLADETKNAPKEESQKLLDKQDQLNKDFTELRKDLDDLQQKNDQLEKPNELENTGPQEESIQKELNNSKENLQQSKNKGASQSQKKASQEMNKLSEALQKMKESMEEENTSEDEAAIRDILDNLVKISFSQEELMNRLELVAPNNPKYLKIIEEQKNIKDDLQMVEDSLYAIGKRQPIIEPFILREIASINSNVEDATKALTDRIVSTAKGKQQYVMTAVNNLALMLSESLKQMSDQQKKGNGSSEGSCKKPGGSGSKMKSMRKLQEQLNKQMQQMKDGMEKPGEGKKPQRQMSEQLARMAAQQEALRKQLQEVGEELQKQGSGMDKNIKEMLQKMDATETDLVNKRITRETILRQQEIETRLLESEKALLQRELDEKRESTESRDIFYNNPAKFFDYKKLKNKETEMIRTIPPSLRPFYKGKVNAYFLSFE